MGINRSNLLSDPPQKKTKKRSKVEQNTVGYSITSIVYKHWEILDNDIQFGNLFKENPLFSYKWARSLGKQLTKTDFIESDSRQPTFFGTPQNSTYPCLGLFTCPCGKAYVGKTKRQVKTRIGEHKRSIDNCDLDKMKYVTPISRHFKTHGHNSKQLRWLMLQEVLWIERLNTLAPMGLNEELSYSCFY
ncbi:hypothetical protein XELAEV_18027984mg [Xenopus laevis]|uniref:GIY-YIG domain-containing protein n=1 Tax=Xenopus laevis TaxID=8355 RepID=A0A974CYJ7_XENLA|nr:hypothetical protein XELAEV_18027984mg [Xenopus laevis]